MVFLSLLNNTYHHNSPNIKASKLSDAKEVLLHVACL